MAKPAFIELPGESPIPVLYEDRSILAIDKPAGWMLVPVSWQKTDRNLQAALLSSIAAGHFWARSRNIKFLRYVHRLDAETSGILLLAKSIGALNSLGALFAGRKMEKVYLAIAERRPQREKWTCRLRIDRDPNQIGRMVAHPGGKPAETEFRMVAAGPERFLIEARPFTGRTHQIRVHLLESGCPVAGDALYGQPGKDLLALRAVGLAYQDPFTRRPVTIRAPVGGFLSTHGFGGADYRVPFRRDAGKKNITKAIR